MNVQVLHLADMIADPYLNPRSLEHKSNEAMQDLVDSIQKHGILQPILVRPAGPGQYVVVAGNRRVEAARMAGLKMIPAMVEDMTDEEAADAALVENMLREDLNPIDEAIQFKRRLDEGMDPAELAALAGRSKSYVWGRLQLLTLPDLARRAMQAGVLPVSTAQLIGRIPSEAMREDAIVDVLGLDLPLPEEIDWSQVEPMSYREANETITGSYMTDLAEAPFDPDLPGLAGAPACGACPHRSGNQVDLFGDIVSVRGEDICTKKECYAAKTGAWAERKLAEVPEGITAIPWSESKEIFRGDHLVYGAKYIAADAQSMWNPDTRNKTVRAWAGKKAPQEYAAVDGCGNLVALYRKSEILTLEKQKREKADAKAEKERAATRARAGLDEDGWEDGGDGEYGYAPTGKQMLDVAVANLEKRLSPIIVQLDNGMAPWMREPLLLMWYALDETIEGGMEVTSLDEDGWVESRSVGELLAAVVSAVVAPAVENIAFEALDPSGAEPGVFERMLREWYGLTAAELVQEGSEEAGSDA